MAAVLTKEEIQRVLDSLPEDATWEDLKYHMHVREQIELGRESVREGRSVPTEEAFAEFDLDSDD